MRIIASAGAAVVAALALLPASPADALLSDTCPSMATISVGPFYVDVRENGENVWIYEETNGVAGLQKGDSFDYACLQYNEAGEPIQPDTVIF